MNRRDCALAFVAALALGGCALPPPPPPHAGPPGDRPPPHERRGPPPEFIEACRAQAEGSSVRLTGRRGEVIDGRCERETDAPLVFRPAPKP
jgi:hypothetical protein